MLQNVSLVFEGFTSILGYPDPRAVCELALVQSARLWPQGAGQYGQGTGDRGQGTGGAKHD